LTTTSTLDSVIEARWVIPVEPSGKVLHQHAVVIRDKHILEIIPIHEAREKYKKAPTHQLPSHALIPGLINAHGHAPMTLLRGLADDLPLMSWLNDHIWPAERRWVSEQFVRDGTTLAIAEMLLSGTTTFVDMYFYPDVVAQCAQEQKIRTQVSSPIIQFPSAWAADESEYVHKALQFNDDYRNQELIYPAFGPHAPYSVSDDALTHVATLAEEMDIPIHMHVHETAQEISDSIATFGKRPLQRLGDLGVLSPRFQAVHAVDLDENDFTLLRESGAGVVHCPKSNMKLASGFCPVDRLHKEQIRVALGTDGASSNNALNMLEEIRTAALMAKAVNRDASTLPAADALKMATLDAANILGLGDEIGSIEPGKRADLTALNFERPIRPAIYDPISHLVYSANDESVSHVWVNGQMLLENRRLTLMDLETLSKKVADWQAKIDTAHRQQQLDFEST